MSWWQVVPSFRWPYPRLRLQTLLQAPEPGWSLGQRGQWESLFQGSVAGYRELEDLMYVTLSVCPRAYHWTEFSICISEIVTLTELFWKLTKKSFVKYKKLQNLICDSYRLLPKASVYLHPCLGFVRIWTCPLSPSVIRSMTFMKKIQMPMSSRATGVFICVEQSSIRYVVLLGLCFQIMFLVCMFLH